MTHGPTHFVYCIECITPNHIYVGETSQLEIRICAHKYRDGSSFTKRHGVKRWCIVASAATKKEAEKLEREEYLRLKTKGFKMGGFQWREEYGQI